jgi:tRNA(Ile2) C34 agmatinyltransferase TiaS
MSSKENILQYELCIMCNSSLAKLGRNYCKKCKTKDIKHIKHKVKNEDSCKIYYYKFHDKNTKARLRLSSSNTDIGI